MTRVPDSTYRLQLPGLGFARAAELLGYLHDLGVGDVYLSPIVQARRGSRHGYDVLDPLHVSTELGGEEAWRAFADEARRRRLGVLVDIVPNHMAAAPSNPYFRDVLQHGADSRYARWFDVDWEQERIVLPVMGQPLDAMLASGELRLERSEEGEEPILRCHRLSLPLAEGSAPADDGPAALRACLARQHYKLAFWREAALQRNYRRFFDVNDLICVRVEDPFVFRATHHRILGALVAGEITGVRVDHVDGLADPKRYLDALHESVAPEMRDRTYVVVEKILGEGEELPSTWRAQGTTGYEFMNAVARLLVHPDGLATLDAVYREFSGEASPEEMDRDCKLLVMEQLFEKELETLVDALAAATDDPPPRAGLRAALAEVTAQLRVYRTYVRPGEVREVDRDRLREAFDAARARLPEVPPAVFDLLRRVLVLDPMEADPDAADGLPLVMLWQQFTGPVMAKGVEDTALYRDHRLLSLCEVGGERRPPHEALGVEAFHRFCARRAEFSPAALNALSTHDTKRSEDVRARLVLLSQEADAFAADVRRWRALNAPLRTAVAGGEAPDANTEWLIYQTLIGAWPLHEAEVPAFRERLAAYLVKALREGKQRTSWLKPDEAYEQAVLRFAAAVASDAAPAEFRTALRAWIERAAFFGAWTSLAQVVLRATAPGVPDVYQGCELFDFSLVDPDNRRPVDFDARARMLAELDAALERGDRAALLDALVASWRDGRVKLYVTSALLRLRRELPELFRAGSYLPLEVADGADGHVCAFARRHGDDWLVTVVGLHLPLLGAGAWGDARIVLPTGAPERFVEILSGAERTGLRVADVLQHLPVAVLRPA